MKILFQGDSITDGNRYKDESLRWDLNHQIGHSYVYPIVGRLGAMYPGKYTFVNRGVSGSTENSLTDRWEQDTLAEKPDLLSLLVGINNYNRRWDGTYDEGTEAYLTAFEKTYRWLLKSARNQNPALKIILMEPFALPVGVLKPNYETFMGVLRRKQCIIRSIAQDFGAVFVPIQEKLEKLAIDTVPVLNENNCPADPYAYWMWDGIHPTEPLHWLLAEFWLAAAQPLL